MPTWLKDLLFTKGNKSLEIARVSTALSLVTYWAGVLAARIPGDALAVGGGCAAIMGGGAAWIHWRQKHEDGEAAPAEGDVG